MEQRVISLFHESIEAKMQAGEALAPLIVEASDIIVHCLVGGGKILAAGNGASAANAQVLSSNLINRFERERPGLPAFTLGMDFSTQTSIANDFGYNDIFAKQIRALGNPGDCLVMFSTSGNPNNLVQAVAAAHEREMNVLMFSGRDGGNVASVLDAHDLEIRVPINARARIHEIHLLCNFCLCDLIDQHLFGAE